MSTLLNESYKIAVASLQMLARVECILYNTNNEILVIKNKNNGHYMFPGGKMEHNETPLDTAKRETAEEAGIGARNLKIIGYSPFIDILHNTTTIFTTGDFWREKESIEKDKSDEILFLDFDNVVELLERTNENIEYKPLIVARIEALKETNKERIKVKKGYDYNFTIDEIYNDLEKMASDDIIEKKPIILIDENDDEDEVEELKMVLHKEALNALIQKKAYSGETDSQITATAGQLMINQFLPPKFKDYERVITKSSLKKVLQKIAEEDPDQYLKVSDNIRFLGDRESTFSIRHLKYSDAKSPVDVQPYLDKAKKEYERILKKNGGNKDYALIDAYGSVKDELNKDVISEGIKKGNLYSIMSASGARGGAAQVTDMIAAPLLVSDYKNRPIPIIIDKSYSQGVTPSQYFAASYGTRRGMISTKMATPTGGYFSKRLAWTMNPMVVTEHDCKTNNGTSYSIDDKWNIGKYLAKSAGNYPKNTYISDKVIEDLKSKNIKNIVVRNATTCESEQGICQLCLGKMELGQNAPIGYAAGLNSSAAISEPISQSMMSEKHTGGAVKKRIGGWPLIDSLTAIPKTFPGRAILAKVHGKIDKIEKAPWGGWKIFIIENDTNKIIEHYTPENNPPILKEGTRIERGDQISDGVINPLEVTQLKGIGEARKSLTNSMRNAVLEMGSDMDRTHFELLARSFINFGIAKEAVGDYLPNDGGRLETMKKFMNFSDKKEVLVKDIEPFKFRLAQQALHHFPGTEITEKVKKELLENGYDKILITSQEPKFEPLMIRAQEIPLYNKDWMMKLIGQGLKKSLMDSVHKSESSSTESNTNFVHPFVYGLTFGKKKIY